MAEDTTKSNGSSASPSDYGFHIGAAISNRYELVQKIGAGANGSVYKAIDRLNNNQAVALKSLTGHDMDDPVAIGRFHNEFMVAQELKHPNLIEIYALGKTGQNQLYMTMEFVEGKTLRQRIKENSLTFPEIVTILRDIAEAMDFAHSRHIIHRDLKPENILLKNDNSVKIVDLGLARNMIQGSMLTKTGEALGTPHYMAPEQIDGARVDGRADIYSLGIIAFEMVAGVAPFHKKEGYAELAHAHLVEPLPMFETLQLAVPDVPFWYEVLVNACCEKNAAIRIQTMAEFAHQLDKHLYGGASGVRGLLSRLFGFRAQA